MSEVQGMSKFAPDATDGGVSNCQHTGIRACPWSDAVRF
jgi:hypothetical protein